MNGSGMPFAGIMASTTLMLNSACTTTIAVMPVARNFAEHVVGAQRRADAAIQEDAKQRDHQQRTPQSQLFRRHREDEVGVRLRQIEELLLAFHQAQARSGRQCSPRSSIE